LVFDLVASKRRLYCNCYVSQDTDVAIVSTSTHPHIRIVTGKLFFSIVVYLRIEVKKCVI